MQRATFLAAILALTSSVALTQPRFQQVVEVTVQPGHELAYEGFLKKLVEAANETGSPMTWSAFVVPVGKSNPTYRIALGFDKWGDRDQWQDVMGLVTKAYGADEARKILAEGRTGILSVQTRVWELLEDGSSNPGGAAPSAQYDIWIRTVSQESVPEVRELQRQFKEGYEAKPNGPSVSRWVLRYGENTGRTFRRVQGFDSWAARDADPGLGVLREHFGAERTVDMTGRFGRAVTAQERFVSSFREELSRPQASQSSN